MKAIRFNAAIPRYAFGLALGKWFPSVLWSGLCCTSYEDVPEPALPGGGWVKIITRYGGICGSDMSTVHLHTSPYYSPLCSFPFTLGHEAVGRVGEIGQEVSGWNAGDRVVVEPILWCKPRGFESPCRYCRADEINRCERFTDGVLAPGQFIGSCRDTGGSWSAVFVAHHSQLYRVPDEISDENALLVEPLAVGLHAALTAFPKDDDTVLIMGGGVVGLCTLAALRLLGSRARIVVAAKHAFQADAATKLSACQTVSTVQASRLYEEMATHTGGRLFKPIVGKSIMTGGADVVYECAGTDASLDDSMRFTRNGGRLVLVGMPGVAKGVDWTSLFAKELEVTAAFAYHHNETFSGKWRTFDLALHLMQSTSVDLGWLITHRFSLQDYSRAFRLLGKRGKKRVIKAVFDLSL